ncbi:branched-chain amino acid ABC transporter permease [Natronomonas sp.]|uniref:branched-chain amino acid ABC transporter permease n=1 Tax=Natronomonas sp. TaxID=2184060 RepID=UPI002616BCFE|nr:branched-chain amino acid ABC transporter permease [Natronomonas sp.]
MSGAEQSADDRGTLAAVWEQDAVKLTALVSGLFAAYVVGGLLLSYGLRQQLNELAQLSFFIAVFAMLALALNLHWGYTGLFNIGVIGFMGIGIYTTAILSKGATLTEPAAGTTGGFGLPLWIGIIGGVVAAGLFGGLVALPALRLRADYFAIVTVGLSEVVRFTLLEQSLQQGQVLGYWVGLGGGSGLLLDFDPVDRLLGAFGLLESYTRFSERTGEAIGIGSNPKPVFDGILYGLVLLVFLVGFYVLLTRVGSSPYGRVLKAIREDEDATKALGKDTDRFKIKAFVIGCALMGLGGILLYASQGAITPNAFRPRITFFVWIALIIGGAGSNTGSVMGGAIFAAVLYQGPIFFSNVIEGSFEIDAVNTFAQAVGPLAAADPVPLLAYTVDNIGQLRFVIMGLVLIYLMHNRPEGILGHRKETASTIPLGRRRAKTGGSPPATDGGEENRGVDGE